MGIWRRPRDLETSAPLVAAVMALGVAALTVVGTHDFPLDDAWIHLAYAKSLRAGDGLSYNPGDWETGVSSPLWVALLAVWPLGSDPVIPVKLLGALLHGLTAFLATGLALHWARDRATEDRPVPVLAIALLSGTLVATTPTALQAATSGMAVPLASALTLATIYAVVCRHPVASGASSALAVLARPETLAFVLAFSIPRGWIQRKRGHHRDRAPWAAALGAGLGLASWMTYCWLVSGHLWPNTQYVKGTGGGPEGLRYLVQEVLPWQPWLISLTGAGLLAWAIVRELRERRDALVLVMLAATATWIAIALTRPLHPGVLFFERRYFTPFAPMFALVVPFGLIGLRQWLAFLLILPVAILTGIQAGDLLGQQRRHEQDTMRLHTSVARYVADALPPEAIVAVEGAGASRYFTPRSMEIVDLVGLNDRAAAHLHFDHDAKICHYVRKRPTHMVLPEAWLDPYGGVFELDPMAMFHDDDYTQVAQSHPRSVIVHRVVGVRPPWQKRCQASSK